MLCFETLCAVFKFNQHIEVVRGRVIKKLKMSENFKKFARTKIFIWNSIKLTCLGMVRNRDLLLYTLKIPQLQSKEVFFMKVTHIKPIFLPRVRLNMNHPFFPIYWSKNPTPEPATYEERVAAMLEYDKKIENASFSVSENLYASYHIKNLSIYDVFVNEYCLNDLNRLKFER